MGINTNRGQVLRRLQDEILTREPAAALPMNLPDHWLDYLGEMPEGSVPNMHVEAGEPQFVALMALVFVILSHRARPSSLTVSVEEMLKCVDDYRLEVALEQINRHTKTQVTRATLKTIFHDRTVQVKIVP